MKRDKVAIRAKQEQSYVVFRVTVNHMRMSKEDSMAHEQMIGLIERDTDRHKLKAMYEIDIKCTGLKTPCGMVGAS